MSDFKAKLGFEDCWSNTGKGRSVRSPAAGSFSTGKTENDGQGGDGAEKNPAGGSVSGGAGRSNAQSASISTEIHRGSR
ncbi:hypothetical protein ROA7450_03797 [Roseovarius albus]|uniref:Uncharacterized protein n=1 Tax=Roseovarius albus TaxID=1247867 RepID=A0A1X7A3W0_9RHOB|nr:hypothetical protein [Roseovarius albus]SLN69928.1 hypothetical protein ROA7450_03797 [Roseovarius albus]